MRICVLLGDRGVTVREKMFRGKEGRLEMVAPGDVLAGRLLGLMSSKTWFEEDSSAEGVTLRLLPVDGAVWLLEGETATRIVDILMFGAWLSNGEIEKEQSKIRHM